MFVYLVQSEACICFTVVKIKNTLYEELESILHLTAAELLTLTAYRLTFTYRSYVSPLSHFCTCNMYMSLIKLHNTVFNSFKLHDFELHAILLTN